jgi:hypothetical protein
VFSFQQNGRLVFLTAMRFFAVTWAAFAGNDVEQTLCCDRGREFICGSPEFEECLHVMFATLQSTPARHGRSDLAPGQSKWTPAKSSPLKHALSATNGVRGAGSRRGSTQRRALWSKAAFLTVGQL